MQTKLVEHSTSAAKIYYINKQNHCTASTIEKIPKCIQDNTMKCTETWRNLADCCRMPSVSLVTVRTLDKYGTITETFGKHFTADVIQSNAFTCIHTMHTSLLLLNRDANDELQEALRQSEVMSKSLFSTNLTFQSNKYLPPN